MRDIKFRAWDGKYKKMHYKILVGNLHDEENYTAHSVYLRPGDTDYKIDHPGQWMNFDEHSDYVLMQYTGRKDKNEKDVYDGDIVKSANSRELYKIVWSGYGWRITPLKGKRAIQSFVNIVRQEIIGNIYENPTLLP